MIDIQIAHQSDRKRVLFLTAPIQSHILPTFYLADLLAEEYDIYYTVASDTLAEIVKKNGYNFIIDDEFRSLKGMEYSYLKHNNKKAGFWQVIWSVWTNEIFDHRKKHLLNLIDRLKPDVIFIDIFHSADFIALSTYCNTIRFLFYNPMLSTYSGGNLPFVLSESNNISKKIGLKDNLNFVQRVFENFRQIAYRNALQKQWQLLLQENLLPSQHRAIPTQFGYLFEGVPELILAPIELELLPDLRKKHQYYMGLCKRDFRADVEIDGDFDKRWLYIINQKKNGLRILYCSFGTFYKDSNEVLIDFVERLILAVSCIKDVQLVCSIDESAVGVLESKLNLSQNIHLFNNLPQLLVLKETEVYITHGGIGSIKESILASVPMVVYPLDLRYDQYGNGLRVESHGLGLQGIFRSESSHIMVEKITQLLEDSMFKKNVDNFKIICENMYANHSNTNILKSLLTLEGV